MARWRWPAAPFLLLVAERGTSSAFQSGAARPVLRSRGTGRPANHPGRGSLCAISDGRDDEAGEGGLRRDAAREGIGPALRRSRGRRRRGRRRGRRVIHHHESITTGAGAEQLFSLSLWSSSKPAPAPGEEIYGPLSADLPPIDCGWACRSDEEEAQLRRMKLLLGSEMQSLVNEGLHETYPDVYGDLRLLRFLRKSKERDVASAADRYRSFLRWRREKNVDGIRAMVQGDRGAASFAPQEDRLRAVAPYFPMNFEYVTDPVADEEGEGRGGGDTVRPAVLHVGSFDTFGVSERMKAARPGISLDDFLDYWTFLYEAIHLTLHRQSIASREMTFLDEVCDLSGLSVRQFTPYFVAKVMKPWLRMTQSYYPETTRRIYILNPPKIVSLAWNLVTPLLSQGTVDKIRFKRNFKGTAEDFCSSSSEY